MKNLCVSIGRSFHKDSQLAGREAASVALKSLGRPPDLLIVFGSTQFNHGDLQEGILSVMGDVALVGGTTAGEISSHGVSDQSVVLMALACDDLSFTTGLGENLGANETACGLALMQDIQSRTSLENALSLLIFPCGLGTDTGKIMDGIHQMCAPSLEVVGGGLADDSRFEITHQYLNGKVYANAIAGTLVSGDSAYTTGVGVGSGFESIGNRFYCTKSDGKTVIEFNGEPALALYKEFLGEELCKRLPEVCLEFPFGLIDEKVSNAGKEHFQLRAAFGIDHERDTMRLAGSIPEGSAVTLTTASRGDIINGARSAAQQAVESLRGAAPKAALMFSCIGRKLVLGRRIDEEVLAVREVIGMDVPLAGFYTYGEIGPINKLVPELSPAKLHHETVVVWILGEQQ